VAPLFERYGISDVTLIDRRILLAACAGEYGSAGTFNLRDFCKTVIS
jgi:hypothetical protein